ncbi:hypothetical protein [Marinilactibacillus kalidii]|uniref:hypothetical protein n=1 Tax=Marinilactibacillus kalidii TaxID=2820274 RepID=UPI001ABDDD97|nr:hypothetical protein [Marinilactibacillus kalidii]
MNYTISYAKDLNKENFTDYLSSVFNHLPKTDYNKILEATFGSTILAIAVSWSNPFHPYAEYLRIYIDPLVTDPEECFIQLLKKLERSVASGPDRFVYTLMSDQTDTIKILESLDYKLIRKTFEPTLTLEHCLDQFPVSPYEDVLSYKEVFANKQLKRELLGLLKRNYEATHVVNPVVDMTLQEWADLLIGEKPDFDLSLVALTAGTITAYVTVFRSQSVAEVAWLGTNRENDTTFFILKRLFKTQLRLFARNQLTTIETEIDTTDPFARSLFSIEVNKASPHLLAYSKLI